MKIATALFVPILLSANTYTVTDGTDTNPPAGNPNDLRYELNQIAASSDLSPTVEFNLMASPPSIVLSAPLPFNLPIFAMTTQPTFTVDPGSPSVTIDGGNVYPGLALNGGSPGGIFFNIPDNTTLTLFSCVNTLPLDPTWQGNANFFTANTFSKQGNGAFIIENDNPADLEVSKFNAPIQVVGGSMLIQGPAPTSTNSKGIELLTEGGITVYNGAVFGGTGLVTSHNPIAPPAPLLISTGGTLEVQPGVLSLYNQYQLANNPTGVPPDSIPLNLGGSIGGSIVKTTITGTTVGTIALFNQNIDLSGADLLIDSSGASSAPTIYVPFIVQNGHITAPFHASSAEVFYSPKSDPNAVLVAVNVPEGISSADIVFGKLTFPSVVLSDPCAGIVVLALLTPSELQSILNSFFTNQSSLTIQALGNVTTSVNSQIIQRRYNLSSNQSSAIAAWKRASSLIAAADEPDNKKLSTFLAGPTRKETPKLSFSANVLGLFQEQDAITTDTAFFSAYDSKSGGVTVGFDYIGMDTVLVGGAATYIFTHLAQEKHLGTQDIQSILGTAYSGFIFNELTLDLLVTGGYNRNNSIRNFTSSPGQSVDIPGVGTITTPGIPGGTGKAGYNSYQLTPHFDLNYEIPFGSLSLLPFIQSDCAITFQDSFKERDAGFFAFSACGNSASLNLQTEAITTFLLQNEAGVNLFSQIDFKGRGLIVFRFKGSYVNRYTVPYTLESKLLGSTAFTPTRIKLPMQNFAGYSAEVIYRLKTFSANFSYEGLAGSGYLYNAGFIRIAKDF